MKLVILAAVVLGAFPVNAEEKCDCVYPYQPDPPCVRQCTSLIIASAESEEQLRKWGFSPEDASKLWKSRSSLMKQACQTGSARRPDVSKVSASLEASITHLIGADDYEAFASRVRDAQKGQKHSHDVASTQSKSYRTTDEVKQKVYELCQ